MNPGDFFALLAVIGGLLLATLMLTNAYKRRLDFKIRKLELEAQAWAPQAGRDNDRADLLEDRVSVLERIATDRGQDLAYQIESLRDRRATEAQ